MAASWCRLWHELPNDPKWRTIARISRQSISEVISVFVHVLVCSSESSDRGSTDSLCVEDIASALDMDEPQVQAILDAMEGRVIVDGRLKSWEKRQPKREDDSAERVKRYRNAAETQGNAPVTQGNAAETQGNAPVTQGNAAETQGNAPVTQGNAPDTDTDTDTDTENTLSCPNGHSCARPELELEVVSTTKKDDQQPEGSTDFEHFWALYPKHVEKKRAYRSWTARIRDGTTPADMIASARNYATCCAVQKTDQRYVKHAATFLGPDKPFLDFVSGVPPDLAVQEAEPAGFKGIRDWLDMQNSGGGAGFEQ